MTRIPFLNQEWGIGSAECFFGTFGTACPNPRTVIKSTHTLCALGISSSTSNQLPKIGGKWREFPSFPSHSCLTVSAASQITFGKVHNSYILTPLSSRIQLTLPSLNIVQVLLTPTLLLKRNMVIQRLSSILSTSEAVAMTTADSFNVNWTTEITTRNNSITTHKPYHFRKWVPSINPHSVEDYKKAVRRKNYCRKYRDQIKFTKLHQRKPDQPSH